MSRGNRDRTPGADRVRPIVPTGPAYSAKLTTLAPTTATLRTVLAITSSGRVAGAVLGCHALILLHDAAGHLLFVTTQRAWAHQRRETAKARRYEREHDLLHRYRADLVAYERPMYELDNAQDQIMTACTVALTTLALWVRDHYFPAFYRQATWARLAPFFRLPGRIAQMPTAVHVALRPFNDRALTRDLALLCERVRAARPCLPDGRMLIFSVAEARRPFLHVQTEAVA